MCQTAIRLTSKSLADLTDAKRLRDIEGVVALFIQTMEVGEALLDSEKYITNTELRAGDIPLPC